MMNRKPLHQLTFVIFLLFAVNYSFAQSLETLSVNRKYSDIRIKKSRDTKYQIRLKKGAVYKFKILQNGIDVRVQLFDTKGQQLFDKNTPNAYNGYELTEYSPTKTDDYILKFVPRQRKWNPAHGKIDVFVHKLTKSELKRRKKISKELEAENNKTVQTLDIDHFWEAFDDLEKAKTNKDSIDIMQRVYIDRATNGFKDFISKWSVAPEKLVEKIAKRPKYYNSIRKNTFEVKKAVPIIKKVVLNFQQIYSGFKPKKICFFIGDMNVGGTVSDNFLLIGTAFSTGTKHNDLSELSPTVRKILSAHDNALHAINELVAHEYVHTQQVDGYDKDAIRCELLYDVLDEGIADFIGEMISGSSLTKPIIQEYGDRHEKQLWKEFKNELCNDSNENWLYNDRVKDKPGDLGYYIGYKIAEEYYKNATDKSQAIKDIIEMNDPIKFLQRSKYDQKEKN